MKINLLLDNKKGILNNWFNIDAHGDGQSTLKADVFNLDHSIEHGEAEIIIARHILEYAPLSLVPIIIYGWLKKLGKNGKLLIEGTDFEKVAMDVYYGNLDFIKFHEIMYGKQSGNWDFKRSMLSMSNLSRFFEEMENPPKITQKRFDNHNFIIEVQK